MESSATDGFIIYNSAKGSTKIPGFLTVPNAVLKYPDFEQYQM